MCKQKQSTIQIPTHFRFKERSEANEWDRTTKDWIPIEEIHFREDQYSISAINFAWVYYDPAKPNLEFAIMPYFKCKGCNESIVEDPDDLCESCYGEED